MNMIHRVKFSKSFQIFTLLSFLLFPFVASASVKVSTVSVNGTNFPGGLAVATSPGQSLNIQVSANNSSRSDRWLYTRFSITKSGTQILTQCVDTADIKSVGNHTISFNINLPSNIQTGTSTINIRTFSNSKCTTNAGPNFPITNGLYIFVPVSTSTPPVPPSSTTTPPIPPDTSSNLILNPNLQVATIPTAPDFWHVGGYDDTFTTSYPVPGPNVGDKAAKVTVTTHRSGFADWYPDTVSVTPLTEYRFSDSYMSDVPTIIEAQYTISGASGYLYTDIVTLPATNGVWATSNVTFTTPPGATSLTIFHLINSKGSLTVTNTSLVKTQSVTTFKNGMVTLAFDDGVLSQYNTAIPILNTANMKATFNIISGEMIAAQNGDDLYMNQSQVNVIKNFGHEIGNHTVNHCDLKTGLCPDGNPPNSKDPLTVKQEIEQANTTLRALGTKVDTFAYPYGSYNQTTTNTMKTTDVLAARTVDRGYNSPNSDRYTLKIQYVNSSVVSSSDFQNIVKPWIDTAVQNKVWLVLLFHAIEPQSVINQENDPDATTPEMFQNIVNYLKQNNISVVTMHDAVCQMSGMETDARCAK